MKAASVNRFLKFIIERQNIFLAKEVKEPKPWTRDKILQKYRFCNVYREQDTVTKWIAEQWRFPYQMDPDLWFAMAVARLVNWPDTLEMIGYPVPWDEKKFLKTMSQRKKAEMQLYNGAYIISTNGVRMDKAKYLAKKALTPMWKNRKNIRFKFKDTKPQDCFYHLYLRLIEQRNLGSFMAGQIIADLKYALPYRGVSDWETFAASGPGSRRGLNRVMGYSLNDPWKEPMWHAQLLELKREVDPVIRKYLMPNMHAQDLQNCLCEFDKYERVRLGEGRPKSLYNGGKDG